MRIDQLYGPGGLDMGHPSYNVLDQFIHADPDDPAEGVQVQHFDAQGRQVELRHLTPSEVEFFFAEVGRPTPDGELSAVAAFASASVVERLISASDPGVQAIGESLAAAAEGM